MTREIGRLPAEAGATSNSGALRLRLQPEAPTREHDDALPDACVRRQRRRLPPVGRCSWCRCSRTRRRRTSWSSRPIGRNASSGSARACEIGHARRRALEAWRGPPPFLDAREARGDQGELARQRRDRPARCRRPRPRTAGPVRRPAARRRGVHAQARVRASPVEAARQPQAVERAARTVVRRLGGARATTRCGIQACWRRLPRIARCFDEALQFYDAIAAAGGRHFATEQLVEGVVLGRTGRLRPAGGVVHPLLGQQAGYDTAAIAAWLEAARIEGLSVKESAARYRQNPIDLPDEVRLTARQKVARWFARSR